MIELNEIWNKIEKNTKIISEHQKLRKGIATLALSKYIPIINELINKKIPIYLIYAYLSQEVDFPKFITERKFNDWFTFNYRKKKLMPMLEEQNVQENDLKESKNETRDINNVENRAVNNNDKNQDKTFNKGMKLQPENKESETKFIIDENKFFKDQASVLEANTISLSTEESKWLQAYQQDLTRQAKPFFWDKANTILKEVEILEETKKRNFIKVPKHLYTLNPKSEIYPFFSKVNWFLYDENGIVYLEKKQLPILEDMTIYPISFTQEITVIPLDIKQFGSSYSLFEIEMKLQDYFTKTGKFAPVRKIRSKGV